MATQLWSAALIIVSTLISSLGTFYLKVGSAAFSLEIKSIIKNLPVIGGLALQVFSTLLGVIAYKGGDLTFLVPLGALNYIWASILAVSFLKEKMNRWKWLGITTIMVGIVLIGLGEAP